MSDPITLPSHLRNFVDNSEWIFAKTMPEWPHEYIVRDRIDEKLFLELVRHIRQFGQMQRFYHKRLIYFEEDGLLYWTMGEPIDESVIINRCKEEESYESRLRSGTLPEDRKLDRH